MNYAITNEKNIHFTCPPAGEFSSMLPCAACTVPMHALVLTLQAADTCNDLTHFSVCRTCSQRAGDLSQPQVPQLYN